MEERDEKRGQCAAGDGRGVPRWASRIEGALEWGGTQKDVAFLVASALSLTASAALGGRLPVDPAWVAIVLCGVPIVCEAAIALVVRHDIKADLLVSLALVASLAIGEYFAAGEVVAIMQLGGLLEELTVARARRGIARLVDLTPMTARVLRDGAERVVGAGEVRQGETVRVLPGETIPVDGVITSGSTSVNQAVMTGESVPVDKGPGDEVSSGTVNQFGAIELEATRVGDDSSIRRMVRLVESADAGKAPIVGIADRWATWVVAGALAIAVVTWLVTGDAIRAVTVLVVFCPCSLVLATPTAVMAAIGNATKHGFLVKEGDALERLDRVRRVAFDKTGTLTYGSPAVVEVVVAEEGAFQSDGLLALVAAAESGSEHPLGRAIAQAAPSAKAEVRAFRMLPGLGVCACVDGREVAAGSERLLDRMGVSLPPAACEAEARQLLAGRTVVHVTVDGVWAGLVSLADEARPEAAQTVAGIRAAGAQPVLLTGDSDASARAIAAQVGIDEVLPRCLPQDKLAYIKSSEDGGCPVCMVGDGVNDAPALRRAYVGIAMGGIGSDIAVDAADIALVDDAVGELPHLMRLAHHMMRVIRANLAFSMALNFVAVALAVAGVMGPVVGALVHNAGSVLVISNSALLLGWRYRGR